MNLYISSARRAREKWRKETLPAYAFIAILTLISLFIAAQMRISHINSQYAPNALSSTEIQRSIEGWERKIEQLEQIGASRSEIERQREWFDSWRKTVPTSE